MLRRGCESLTSEQIDFRIDALGAEMAVDTSHSTVAIHAQVIARNLDAFVDLLSRLLSTATFPEEELERLKRESVAEIIEARDNDRVVAQKAMQRTLFEGHPYGQSSGGTTQSVQAITVDDVRAFYRRFVVRENIVIGIAGDVTAAAGARARGAPRGGPAARESARPTRSRSPRCGRGGGSWSSTSRSGPRRRSSSGRSARRPHDEDHVPLVVGNAVFGGTFTSRLMKEIRSKRGWSYGASARDGRRPPAPVVGALDLPCRRGRRAVPQALARAARRVGRRGRDAARGRLHPALPRPVARLRGRHRDQARCTRPSTASCLALPADYFSAWLDRVRAVTPSGGDGGRQEPASTRRTCSSSSSAPPPRCSNPCAPPSPP